MHAARFVILACIGAAFVLSTAAACQREGSAPKAGRQIDRAVAKAGDKFDDTVDKARK